ncbi:MAG: sulfite exporter TauE/SafE family protein [Candidatus Cloacimonetes bacterium]|nr:sulfite exporter TauE/SafE family protein [Candidatus Cloacimonadota bacterium]
MNSLILWGSIIIAASALLQGLSGFGFSILSLPLLSMFLSPKTVVPVLLIFSMIINVTVIISCWRSFSIHHIWRLLVGGIIGLPLGAKLLMILDDDLLRRGIGFFVVVFALLLLTGKRWQLKREKLAQPFIGFLSGIFSGSVGISGPPIILFLSNKGVQKDEFRANLAGYFFLINLFTIPVYFYNHLFTKEVVHLTFQFLPFLLLGVISGAIIAKKIKPEVFSRLVLYLLLITGILAMVK